MTEPSQPPRLRRGTRLHRETNGDWTLFGDQDVEDLSSVPPIVPRDWADVPEGAPPAEPDGGGAE